MTGSVERIDASTACDRLQPTTAMLETDGYELRVEDGADGRLRVLIDASPDACEECLVPKPIMASIISGALSDAGTPEFDLFYPGDPR